MTAVKAFHQMITLCSSICHIPNETNIRLKRFSRLHCWLLIKQKLIVKNYKIYENKRKTIKFIQMEYNFNKIKFSVIIKHKMYLSVWFTTFRSMRFRVRSFVFSYIFPFFIFFSFSESQVNAEWSIWCGSLIKWLQLVQLTGYPPAETTHLQSIP